MLLKFFEWELNAVYLNPNLLNISIIYFNELYINHL